MFYKALIESNCLMADQFASWHWDANMQFGAKKLWWRPAARLSPHEGLDFAFYKRSDGSLVELGAEVVVPAPFSGNVVGIVDDFIAQTLFVNHPDLKHEGQTLLLAFAHIRRAKAYTRGEAIAAGQIVGRIAAPASKSIPGHLHLSAAWTRPASHLKDLDWPTIAGRSDLQLVDPLSLSFLHTPSRGAQQQPSCGSGAN